MIWPALHELSIPSAEISCHNHIAREAVDVKPGQGMEQDGETTAVSNEDQHLVIVALEVPDPIKVRKKALADLSRGGGILGGCKDRVSHNPEGEHVTS